MSCENLEAVKMEPPRILHRQRHAEKWCETAHLATLQAAARRATFSHFLVISRVYLDDLLNSPWTCFHLPVTLGTARGHKNPTSNTYQGYGAAGDRAHHTTGRSI